MNPKAADENKNEPAPKEDESITPPIPVSNLFEAFSVEPVLEELAEEESFSEENDFENEARNPIDDHARNAEETLSKIRSKLRENLKVSINGQN